MDYEKAIARVKQRISGMSWCIDDEDKEALETIIPELRESEDERLRKAALEGIEYLEHNLAWDAIGDTDILEVKEYLENQKDANKEYWRGYREGKQEILDKYAEIKKQKEQNPTECDKETETQKAFREGQNAGRQEVFDNPGAYGLEKIDNVFGFRIGDKVKLVDGDGRPLIIEHFEKIEGPNGSHFYRVVFKDNTGSDHIIPGGGFPNGYFTRIEKIDEQKEQKDYRKLYEDIVKSEWFKKNYVGKSL